MQKQNVYVQALCLHPSGVGEIAPKEYCVKAKAKEIQVGLPGELHRAKIVSPTLAFV
jgi:hypothetical protein